MLGHLDKAQRREHRLQQAFFRCGKLDKLEAVEPHGVGVFSGHFFYLYFLALE